MLWFNLLSLYGSVASLAGLAITLRDPQRAVSTIEVVFYTLAAVMLVICTILIFRSEFSKGRPKICKTKESIVDYMMKWISHPGRVLVFTRDMSWASNAEVKSALVQKAHQNELTIILEKRIPLADELQRIGAKVATYEALHRPLERYIGSLLNRGLSLVKFREIMPSPEIRALYPVPWKGPRYLLFECRK